MWPRYNNRGAYPHNQNTMQSLQNRMHKQHRFNSQTRGGGGGGRGGGGGGDRYISNRPPYDSSSNSNNKMQGNSSPTAQSGVKKEAATPEIKKEPVTPTPKTNNTNAANSNASRPAPAAAPSAKGPEQPKTTPTKTDTTKQPPLPPLPPQLPPNPPSEPAKPAEKIQPEQNAGSNQNQYQKNQYQQNSNQYQNNQNSSSSQYQQNQNKPYQQNQNNKPYQQNNKPYQQNQGSKPYQQNQDTQEKPYQQSNNQEKPYQQNQNKPYNQNQYSQNQSSNQYNSSQNSSSGFQSTEGKNQYRQSQYDQAKPNNQSRNNQSQPPPQSQTGQNSGAPSRPSHDNRNQEYPEKKPYGGNPRGAWHGNQQGASGGGGGDSWKRSEGGASNYNNYDSRPYRGGPGGPGGYNKGMRGMYPDRIRTNLENSIYAPLVDLPPYDTSEKKFNVFAKLFVGNIPKGTEDEEVLALFKEFGEIGPVYFSKEASFGFITFDFKANAVKAVKNVDNKCIRNRPIKVRFATINEGIRVKNLSKYASNELLEKTFSIFGQVENCRVVVDDRGVPKGEGVIIFKDKRCAINALKKCQEECFFLSGSLRPVVLSALEPMEDATEGLSEEMLIRDEEYRLERDTLPHFADPNSFEQEFGTQWMKLFNMYDEKKSILDRDFKIEIERLEKKMVLARVEFETEKLRKELAQREAETEQLRRHFGGEEMGSRGYPSAGGYGAADPVDGGYGVSSYDAPYGESYDTAGADYGYGAQDDFTNYERNAGGYGADTKPPPPYEAQESSAPKRSLTQSPYDQGYEATPSAKPMGKRPRY